MCFSDWSTQQNHDIHTFSVRPTIPESKNIKVVMKKFGEEKNEDFCEDKYFNFEDLIFGKKTF